MLEKELERKLYKSVSKIGGLCIKINSPQNNGLPDRLCIFPDGDVLFVELKKPVGGIIAPLQKYQHKKLKRLKQTVVIIWTESDIRELIQRWEG